MSARRRPARTPRPRQQAQTAVLLAALVTVGASGCSLLPFGADAGASTQTLADGSGFLVGAPTSYLPQAIVSGRLALIGDNCVGLEMPASGENAALAFPHGTHLSDDGGGIVLPDGLQVALGDSITGGGGYTTPSEAPDVFNGWPDAPSGCAKATYLATIYDVKIDEASQE